MSIKYLPKEIHRVGEIIKTFEKNGKPYQTIIKICSRCGGDGNYSHNEIDGTICYGCHGSGVERVDERIYTEKEKISLEKSKIKREEKKIADRIIKATNIEIEKQNKVNEYIQNNPITYIVIDKDSYNKKETIKSNGYKWKTWYWVGHNKIEDIEVITVDTKEIINEYGYILDTAINDKVKEYKNI